MGVSFIEVHHFENRKWLKIASFGWVISVFFEPLLIEGRITPQIKQKI